MFIEESDAVSCGNDAGDTFRSFNLISRNFDEEDISAGQHQQIFTQLPVAILILRGPAYIIESTNDINLMIWGQTREVIGRPLLEVMPDFKDPDHLKILEDVYTTGKPFYSTALPIKITKKGRSETGYYNVEYQPLRAPDGSITGLFVIGFDITSLVTTKLQLQKSEQQFRDMIVHAPVSVAIYRGRNFVFEFANTHYLYRVDRTSEQLIGRPFFEALPELKGQGLEELLNKVLDTGKPHHEREHSLSFTSHGRKEYRYSNFVYQPLRNADNEIDGVMIILNDISDIIKSTKAIKESERQFRNLVMQSPVAMGILRGESWRIDMANDALLKIWDRTAAEVSGKKLMDVFPELEGQPFPALLKQVYKTGKTYGQDEAVAYIKSTAGEMMEKYVQLQYTPMLDADGRPDGIIITINDITAQVKARKQIEENELYFRKMADNVLVIIFLWKSDGYCTYKNRQWFEYTGANLEDAQGFSWFNYVDINSRPEVQQTFFSAVKNKTSLKVELQLRRKDGAYRWFEKAVTPRLNEQGEVEGYIGTLTDIHERKLTEEKLKDAEERLRLAAEATGLATFDMDLQNLVTIGSPRLFEILGLGYKEATAVSRTEVLRTIYPGDLPVIDNAFRQAHESGNYSYEVRVLAPDNSIRWITTRGKIYFSGSHKPLRMIGTVEDITRRKQLEQHKDAFMGIVSHELKTPVTTLKVYTQMLQQNFEAANDHRAVHMLSRMDSQINKLSTLIKDLLDTARIDSGRLQVEHQVFDLNSVIDSVLEDLAITGITHQVVKQNNQAYFILGDAARTAQVITNLLANAVKYAPCNTDIIINTQEKNNFVLCSVQDFGTGISSDNLINVFDKYFRINNSSHGTYPGLGLGLFISSEIIRQQGGEIWADSYEGQGSTFWFSLPLHKEVSPA